MLFSAPTTEEHDFIFDSWIQSFRKSPWAGCVPNSMWFDVQRATIRDILDRGARVIVATTPVAGREDEPRRVMGYSVSEPQHNILHWLYVKSDYRRLGVGRMLLNATCPEKSGEWEYTHSTKSAPQFLGKRFTWNPVHARVKEIR